MYIFAIILSIVSNIFYHLSLKLVPNNTNPILPLCIAYLVAFIVSLIAIIFFPVGRDLFNQIKQIGWAPVILGIVIVGVELGFLLAYRAGWNVSYAAIVSNIFVSIVLLIVGKVFFHEDLHLVQYIGVFLAIVGVALINIK